MYHHDESERIREQMSRIRGDLASGVGDVVQHAKELTDWHTIVRRYPWLCTGAAAAAGFLLVPKRSAPATSAAGSPSSPPRSGHEPVLAAQVPPAAKSGLVGSLLTIAAQMALRSAINVATAQLEQALTSKSTSPAPSTPENVSQKVH